MRPDEYRRRMLRDVKKYLQLSAALGEPVRGEDIRASMARLDWRNAYSALATLAACWARGNDEAIRQLVFERLLAVTANSTSPQDRAVAQLLQRNPDAPIVHEEILYFLEALALVAGNDSGEPVDFGHLGLLMLAANDHI